MESSKEGFMISEEEKGAALEVVLKVEEGRVDTSNSQSNEE